MLLSLGQSTAWNILEGMENGDTEDKAKGEIVNSRANVDEVL